MAIGEFRAQLGIPTSRLRKKLDLSKVLERARSSVVPHVSYNARGFTSPTHILATAANV
jgi:hypothetical protein